MRRSRHAVTDGEGTVGPLFDLAIFDFDGTLADSRAWFFGSLNTVAERFGFLTTTPEEQEALRDCDNREMLRRLRVPMWKLPAIARHMRQLAAENIEAIRLFDGISDALTALHERGTRLAVVSSNAEENVRHVVGAELARHIGFFGCGSSMFGKAAQLKRAIKRIGADPARTVYVGDETRDIQAAQSLGITSAAATWGYGSRAALLASGPSLMMDEIDQLANVRAQSR